LTSYFNVVEQHWRLSSFAKQEAGKTTIRLEIRIFNPDFHLNPFSFVCIVSEKESRVHDVFRHAPWTITLEEVAI